MGITFRQFASCLVQFASIVLQARVAAQICIFDMPHPPRVTIVGKSRVCFDLIYANGCIDIALLPRSLPLLELSTHLHGLTINWQYNGSLADFNMFLACFWLVLYANYRERQSSAKMEFTIHDIKNWLERDKKSINC